MYQHELAFYDAGREDAEITLGEGFTKVQKELALCKAGLDDYKRELVMERDYSQGLEEALSQAKADVHDLATVAMEHPGWQAYPRICLVVNRASVQRILKELTQEKQGG